MTATDEDDFNLVYEKLNTFMGNTEHPLLSESDRNLLETPIDIEELKKCFEFTQF